MGMGEARDECETAADCASGLCGLANVCLAPCAEQSDCPTGQVCQALEARWEDGLEPVQACARVFAFSEDVRLELAKPTRDLPTDEQTTVSTGALAENTVLFLKPDCGASAEVRTLRARGVQEPLFEITALFAGTGTPNPVVNSGALIPLLVPNNPALVAPKSGVELDLSVDTATDLELVIASRDGLRDTLDLNVFLVGAGQELGEAGLTPGSAELTELINRLELRMRKLGMRIGEVRAHSVVGALREELSVIETRPIRDDDGNLVDLEIEGLDQLFELSAGVEHRGVNLFLVSDMGDLLGISGGVPGAIGAHGTNMSGVAIAVDTLGLDAVEAVIQHEISHQLGLFHTSELDGFVIEPLSDTAACTADFDEDGDGVLSPTECREAGANNLMFWAGTGDELSPQQVEILRRSPVLR